MNPSRYMLVLLKILQRLSFFESFESAHSLHGLSSSIVKEELILKVEGGGQAWSTEKKREESKGELANKGDSRVTTLA
ncbi:hypothetical protein MRB53_033068 [Persea americana]|uniref:Uncharacterized protein n=1 Tax=Persea americana TaxID=3435 RepID=A0ACC2KU74_PERAE|nr:hypothetical protein MRB53_033068 [Persea americana]